ncbi:MAG: beta-ketoacyl-ACP synthase III [Vulcanibacillus sp.]
MDVGILGTGSYLPEKILTNNDLEKMVDTSDEWIFTRTGIKERRVATEEQSSSDLAYEAAIEALENANLKADVLDLIIVATVTPDHSMPSTASIIQDRIGAKNASAFDLSAACTGFIYGITTATQFVKAGLYKHVLVIGVDCLSKIIDWTDRNICVLFGDGAGAAIIGPVKKGYGFLSFDLGSDGSGGDLLIQHPGSFLQMNGKEVYKFAVKIMEQSTNRVIEKANLLKEDINFLIPHQANIRIIDYAKDRLKLNDDKVIVNLDYYGNTSSASIPIALDEANRSNKLHDGDNILLVSFGGGLTWGSAIIKWSKQQVKKG